MSAPPKDAASLLVLRDSDEGPQVYMLRRLPSSRFMANALVFVGGRLDTTDADPELQACGAGLDEEEAAARLGMDRAEGAKARGLHVAAVRECFEEAGLLLGEHGPLGPVEQADLRDRLLDGSASFAELCTDRGLRLALGELRFFAHWVTPEVEPRRFDTRFFLCRAPAAQTASVDPREATFGGWFTPRAALTANLEGAQLLAPPTLVILESIGELASVDAILAAAPPPPIPIVQPRLLAGRMPVVLLLPGDHRYDDPSSPSGPLHYVVFEGGRWRRIRDL